MIKIIGIGNGGGNAVNHLSRKKIDVDFAICGTDFQALDFSPIEKKIRIEPETILSLLAEGLVSEGELPEINSFISDAPILICVASLGGVTGSNLLPIVAGMAKSKGILTISIVTMPFNFEGKARMKVAVTSLEKVKANSDGYFVIENDKVREIYAKLTLGSAFAQVDELISEIAEEISENYNSKDLSLKDLNLFLKDSGACVFLQGRSRVTEGASEAIVNAFKMARKINAPINEATYLLVTITSPINVSVSGGVSNELAKEIMDQMQNEPQIVVHIVIDVRLDNEIKVGVIAFGFEFNPVSTIYIDFDESVVLADSTDSKSLQLYFLQDEYTTQEIAEIISFLSDIYKSEGGDELVIKGMEVIEYSEILEPALV